MLKTSTITDRNLFGLSSAVFSACRRYRYRLDRRWDDSLPPLAFGMLNPSTADHERNDPTIERCERRARTMGFGSLIVWNLFAFRATNPKALKEQNDPIGPENNKFILEAFAECKARGGTVIAGWGTHGALRDRNSEVEYLARNMPIELFCLGLTNAGHPKHPLYVPYASKPAVWTQLSN